MKLRWKFFFILLMFSLIPLGIVTFVSQRGTSRMGAVISEDVQQNLNRLASRVLKLTAENSAAILEQSKKSFELALTGLAHEAEVVFAEEPPASVKVYFATDFEDPATAPPDAGPRTGYVKTSADGRPVNDLVSLKHPVVVLAPGVSASDAVEDIDRLSLLTDFLSEISAKLGPALHWAYVSSESGVHVSFPGHGGYPDGYDSLMPPYKEQGIVLRSHKLGEADKIVTIMTQGSGKVRAVAKGIRKTTSRFGARLEPFTHVSLMLYHGRGALDTVTQAEIIAPHAAIRDDLALFAAGETMLEAVDKVAEEHEKNVKLVLLLLAGLRALDTEPAAPDAVAESFLLKLLSLSGFHPSLTACAVCGAR